MPRKKKSGQSPARVPSGLQLERGTNPGYRPPPMASHFFPASSLSKEDIVRNMQEMFSHLDPEIIEIVLSECDFKVENAMDALLELSVTAAEPQPVSASVSGFERTAAELLTPQHFAEPPSQTDQTTHESSTSPTCFITEDLDYLVDQEVQSLSAQANLIDQQSLSQTVIVTEDLQSHLEPLCSGTSTEKSLSHRSVQSSGASSPLDQLSTFDDIYVREEQVPTETAQYQSTLSVDLITSGHSSAFHVYTKQNNTNPEEVMVSEATGTKIGPSYENMDSFASISWNIEAPAFQPHVHESQGSAFITPVAPDWLRGPRHPFYWHRPNTQTPQRAHSSAPRPWALPPPQTTGPQSNRLHLEGKVLVLLRGPPGSGKSTLARALLEHNPSGVILSTDDYFIVNGEYRFDPTVLGEAHSWNHNRARQAFERGANPIIIDNTNMCGWEMRPYVVQALKHSYKVLFREPDTWWKNKPRELERRTKHGVPMERIRRMLCGYERFVTVKSILGSQMPERKQPVATETGEALALEVPCPDIVGESGEVNAKSRTEADPSLPDISVAHDNKYFKDKRENADLGMGEFAKIIPDSNVEHIIISDNSLDELPAAFSESIGQRMKRERSDRKSGVDTSEPAGESKDGYKSAMDILSQQRDITVEKSFDFEGDWPSTASLDQRPERRHERLRNKATERAANQFSKTTDTPKPDFTEMQKLLDLIQTGADPVNTDSSSLSPLSASSGDNDASQSEIKERSTGELPDCVFDSQAAGRTLVGRNEFNLELGASQNTANCDDDSEGPEFESLGESESSQISDATGSQERKQRHNRRSGKSCKLALTFTQNCPEASVDSVESSAADQSNDEPNLDLKTDCELCTETNIMADYEAPPGSSTQTEPHDFALLWRINQNSLDTSVTSTCSFRILCSSPSGYVPVMFCSTASINPTDHNEIPYSVVHEKSTQVEEKEFGTSKDVTENLLILRRHFKQVALDMLEDLFEKCQRDIEWTTNLLLDSGERFFRDDENEEELPSSSLSCTESEDRPSSDVLNTWQYEMMTDPRPDVVVEEIQTFTASESCENIDSNKCDSTASSSILDNNISQENGNKCDLIPQQIKEKSSYLNQSTTPGATMPCDSGSLGDAERVEGLTEESEDDISSINEVHRLLQAELEELEIEEKERAEVKAKMKDVKQKRKALMDIQSVELKLPTELALQLTELFGPVGVDPDTGCPEDCVLHMDLNLAKLLHQKWKESIQERQKQAALSFQLLQESSVHWSKPQNWAAAGSSPGRPQRSRDCSSHQNHRPDSDSHLPFMDHWHVSRQHVSLRDIIKEEMALQENRQKARRSQTDVDKRDGATLLKEDQLFALFPTIDRHFLQDIFKDHNYSLTQTELFLRSLLGEGPAKTVVAPEAPRITPRSGSRDRDKKPVEPVMPGYQDTEDPEYEDFRAEANLQRRRQLESFAKAAEAYKQGHKEVASFYAQQCIFVGSLAWPKDAGG
ncbi:NEDD4-binding protein 2 isoform X2 [Boleophthalmus pectinirostris]|uniref:NEDD4-binding protein 2 isoform X2 n=1 Tax=Boleophthalmus pectinirostris TaxID=150288 RepID=UPI00242F39FC|nr:NEDD4-binding protein 2 isoform X2 [Boleophthalmus pectinirostris]